MIKAHYFNYCTATQTLFSQLNFFSLFATALTPNNVLKKLKEVDWETLCDIYSGILKLPHSQRERIERMYVSEEERKSGGVSFWVNNHPYSSWRLLIRELDRERKHSVANQIHQYAEKVTGMLSSILYCHIQFQLD